MSGFAEWREAWGKLPLELRREIENEMAQHEDHARVFSWADVESIQLFQKAEDLLGFLSTAGCPLHAHLRIIKTGGSGPASGGEALQGAAHPAEHGGGRIFELIVHKPSEAKENSMTSENKTTNAEASV